ncbi:MAG: helix-turn-helix transcriptional regulator [Alphaproteobacteria bacterium]|nr:helix-turn-helix transcriptional regulator [Alphaproteobacteria bacterium]
MADSHGITGAQVRMARAFLRWSVADLAKRANVGISTVQRIEATDGALSVGDDIRWRTEARQKVIVAVHDALVRSGITFLEGDSHGVGVRGKPTKRRS